MDQHTAWVLATSQFDATGRHDAPFAEPIPGSHLDELLELVRCDYDEVDRLYVDSETIGA